MLQWLSEVAQFSRTLLPLSLSLELHRTKVTQSRVQPDGIVLSVNVLTNLNTDIVHTQKGPAFDEFRFES